MQPELRLLKNATHPFNDDFQVPRGNAAKHRGSDKGTKSLGPTRGACRTLAFGVLGLGGKCAIARRSTPLCSHAGHSTPASQPRGAGYGPAATSSCPSGYSVLSPYPSSGTCSAAGNQTFLDTQDRVAAQLGKLLAVRPSASLHASLSLHVLTRKRNGTVPSSRVTRGLIEILVGESPLKMANSQRNVRFYHQCLDTADYYVNG